MFIYRYRPYSELSLKELLYSEMYFSSAAECNDPFDSQIFYKFPNDFMKWKKLILFAIKKFNGEIPNNFLCLLAKHITAQCPLSYYEILNINLFKNLKTDNDEDKPLLKILSDKIIDVLKIYKPASRYFVSFSKTNDEPLMWSHYADKHKGFCLIFKTIDNCINQQPLYKKSSFSRKTKNGIGDKMSYGISNKFDIRDINYKLKVKQLDAFLLMPEFVAGKIQTNTKRTKIKEMQESQFKQKSKSWEYEKETRLILPSPEPWLFGEQVEYSSQERLFHYEPSQLVGIIYGAKMSQKNRQRVEEILQERKIYYENQANYKQILFNFMIFEAKLSVIQREIEIMPCQLNITQPLFPKDKNFEKLYKDWQDGFGISIEENSCKRIKVN